MTGPFIFQHMAIEVDDVETGDGRPRWNLPGRLCDVCGERQTHLELARFDLDPPPTVDRRLFSGQQTLSMAEFERLGKDLTTDPGVRDTLLPGTRIGKPRFRIWGRQHDCLWNGMLPLVSEKTLSSVRERGILVDAVEVQVVGRAKRLNRYFSLLPIIRSVMDEQWMSREKYQCAACSEWWTQPAVRVPKEVLCTKAHVMSSRWPPRCGVVYSPDLGTLIFAPEFVQACQEAELVGFGFGQVIWV